MSGCLEEPLDAVQDQGNTPILCGPCDNMLGAELDGPAKVWAIKQSIDGKYITLDSIMHARFVASILWRGILSKHQYFSTLTADEKTLDRLRIASINSTNTFKYMSFRLRKLTDSTGGLSKSALKNAIYAIPREYRFSKSGKIYTAYIFIYEGFAWELISPKLPMHTAKIKNLLKAPKHRYRLDSFDFPRQHDLLEHGAVQLQKLKEKRITPAFKKWVGDD